jgi:hypothetical protein
MSYTKDDMPYQGHSGTSEAAANSQAPRAATKREIVFYKLREYCSYSNGMTDDEMQVALAMNPSTQRPRRVELVAMRLVVDSGMKRKTRGGEDAVVWRVKTMAELQVEPALSKPPEKRCPACGHKV